MIASLNRGASVVSLIGSRGGGLADALGAGSRLWSPGNALAFLRDSKCSLGMESAAAPWTIASSGEDHALARHEWLIARAQLQERCGALCNRLVTLPEDSPDVDRLLAAWLAHATVLGYLDAQPAENAHRAWIDTGRRAVWGLQKVSSNLALSLEGRSPEFFGGKPLPGAATRSPLTLLPSLSNWPPPAAAQFCSDGLRASAFQPRQPPPSPVDTEGIARGEAAQRGWRIWSAVANDMPPDSELHLYALNWLASYEFLRQVGGAECFADPGEVIARYRRPKSAQAFGRKVVPGYPGDPANAPTPASPSPPLERRNERP
jgi:hypothetical protein